MARLVALIAVWAALAATALAKPSFDCAEARTSAEQEICKLPELQWFDRQLARLYRLARGQAGAARDELQAEQRRFIEHRDACGARYDCLIDVYKRRLAALSPRVNVYEAFAEYQRRNPAGTFWIVRFGFDAALSFATVGDTGHLCGFETDSAPVGGKGVVRWRGKGEGACRIDIIPDGDDMRVETRNCRAFCGARAVMDGLYVKAR
jgi:uncharacterized protein